MSYIVAIDGPAGSGKGTITKLVAKDLGLVSIDTIMKRSFWITLIQI